MVLSTFVPARSSRHRAAALALYRALIRAGRKIPLPQDTQRPGLPVHPVAHLVRKRFTKNRPYTSYRLLYATMTAGYKFLTLFTQARTPDSAEHAQIVDFLRTRQKSATESRAALPARPAKRIPPEKPGPPLLTNVARPGELPYYISTIRPMPKDAFEGERKIPSVAVTASGLPFLRMKKPQPPMLSKIVGLKTNAYQKKMETVKIIEDELVPDSALEDQWDQLVEAQMKLESVPNKEGPDTDMSSYSWFAQVARMGARWRAEETWQDWIARGEALQRIVDEERALATQEKGESMPPRAEHNATSLRMRPARDQEEAKLKVVRPSKLPISLVLSANKAHPVILPAESTNDEETKDPFDSPLWTELVKREQQQLIYWATKYIREPQSALGD